MSRWELGYAISIQCALEILLETSLDERSALEVEVENETADVLATVAQARLVASVVRGLMQCGSTGPVALRPSVSRHNHESPIGERFEAQQLSCCH